LPAGIFATKAAFRSVLLLFNLLAEFQRAIGSATYGQPATLRAQAFLCGALLGRAAHRLALHLSTSWGGLWRLNFAEVESRTHHLNSK
jgi:hypothetical protein